MNSPTYAGVEVSEAAEEFLTRAVKIYDLFDYTGQEKVVLEAIHFNAKRMRGGRPRRGV